MIPTAPVDRPESRTRLAGALMVGAILGLAVLLNPVQMSIRAADQPSTAGVTSTNPLDARALARLIDQEVQQRLDADKLPASPRADDAEFLRRVYLDLTGVIPTADQARAFLDSKDPEKRATLIDALLANPNYGRHLADIWEGLLVQRSSDLKRLSVEPLTRWLEAGFNSNKPWDRLVTELVTATGPQDENGAVTFFVANPTADKVTDKVCQLFLGVQLQCAQCHNHPFTSWKQTEYWGMATFFTKVQQSGAGKKAIKQGATPTVSEDSTGKAKKGKQAKLPESALMVPAKFLQGEQPKLNPSAPYRPVLAKWMTSPDNPFFARAMVNRTWAQFFGRGIVNPIADMHERNVPSHPRLLQSLTEQFKAHAFDLKFLARAVCNSETYQRTSKPLDGNKNDAVLFSHMAIKGLSPEQLYDSLTLVTGAPAKVAERRLKQGKQGYGGPRAAFVAFFQTDDGADPTEYQGGIPQALRLMNSPQFSNSPALLREGTKPGQTPADLIEYLYLALLSRRPSAAEDQRLLAYVREQHDDVRKAAADILWALLNSSEFTLNH